MNVESILESLLFISGEPMGFGKLAKITSIGENDLKSAADALAKKYNEENRGLRILIKDNRVQMVTAGENSQYVDQYLKADIEGDLSRAALEVLSIIAYRGPISRAEVEQIRGVNCSFTVRHLLIRGLIERINNPNDARAYLYRISFEFLKEMGVEKVEDLPNYAEMHKKIILDDALKAAEKEEAKNEIVMEEKPRAEAKTEEIAPQAAGLEVSAEKTEIGLENGVESAPVSAPPVDAGNKPAEADGGSFTNNPI